MPCERSVRSTTAPGSGVKKLGQPVPLSNLLSERNSGTPRPDRRRCRCAFVEVGAGVGRFGALRESDAALLRGQQALAEPTQKRACSPL
jgi:hypothetical protein